MRISFKDAHIIYEKNKMDIEGYPEVRQQITCVHCKMKMSKICLQCSYIRAFGRLIGLLVFVNNCDEGTQGVPAHLLFCNAEHTSSYIEALEF